MFAERLWLLSCLLHRRGHRHLAKLVKAVNFHLNHGLLPYQADVASDIKLGHHGMGVVIHPDVTIGRRVYIWHSVTIATETTPGSDVRVVIEDDVMIGAGAIIVARPDQGLTVGRGARIGAGSVVTRDVAPGLTVVGSPARPIATRNAGHLTVPPPQSSRSSAT